MHVFIPYYIINIFKIYNYNRIVELVFDRASEWWKLPSQVGNSRTHCVNAASLKNKN